MNNEEKEPQNAQRTRSRTSTTWKRRQAQSANTRARRISPYVREHEQAPELPDGQGHKRMTPDEEPSEKEYENETLPVHECPTMVDCDPRQKIAGRRTQEREESRPCESEPTVVLGKIIYMRGRDGREKPQERPIDIGAQGDYKRKPSTVCDMEAEAMTLNASIRRLITSDPREWKGKAPNILDMVNTGTPEFDRGYVKRGRPDYNYAETSLLTPPGCFEGEVSQADEADLEASKTNKGKGKGKGKGNLEASGKAVKSSRTTKGKEVNTFDSEPEPLSGTEAEVTDGVTDGESEPEQVQRQPPEPERRRVRFSDALEGSDDDNITNTQAKPPTPPRRRAIASSPKEPPRPNIILVKITCSVAWICAVPNPHKYVPKPIPDRINTVKVEMEEEDDKCFSADLQRNINKVRNGLIERAYSNLRLDGINITPEVHDIQVSTSTNLSGRAQYALYSGNIRSVPMVTLCGPTCTNKILEAILRKPAPGYSITYKFLLFFEPPPPEVHTLPRISARQAASQLFGRHLTASTEPSTPSGRSVIERSTPVAATPHSELAFETPKSIQSNKSGKSTKSVTNSMREALAAREQGESLHKQLVFTWKCHDPRCPNRKDPALTWCYFEDGDNKHYKISGPQANRWVADCRRGETTVKNPPSWLRREWIAEAKQKQEKKEEKLAEYGINKEDLPVDTDGARDPVHINNNVINITKDTVCSASPPRHPREAVPPALYGYGYAAPPSYPYYWGPQGIAMPPGMGPAINLQGQTGTTFPFVSQTMAPPSISPPSTAPLSTATTLVLPLRESSPLREGSPPLVARDPKELARDFVAYFCVKRLDRNNRGDLNRTVAILHSILNELEMSGQPLSALNNLSDDWVCAKGLPARLITPLRRDVIKFLFEQSDIYGTIQGSFSRGGTAPNKSGSPQARITDPDTIDGLFEDDQTMQSPPIRANNYMDGGNGEEEEEQDGSPPTSEAGNEEDDEFEGACRQTTANSIW
ncbi:hypothetical protein OQA88_9469 [Cercophora sp. LCS_1]